ncbi:MAG: DUF1795 domain-containing protein [Phycisphaerae bacterium]|nr:DUF1795 domain-containing protein [Phycisphaerae bacterium]
MTTRWTVVAAFVLAGAVTMGCSHAPLNPGLEPTPPQSRPDVYRSQEHGYSFIPPASWELGASGGMIDVIYMRPAAAQPEVFRENLNVAVEKLPQVLTLDEYAQAAQAMMALAFREFEVVSLTDIVMGNIQGKRLVCTYSWGGIELFVQSAFYIAVKDQKAYVMTCGSTPENFAAYEKTFDECARTFRVE